MANQRGHLPYEDEWSDEPAALRGPTPGKLTLSSQLAGVVPVQMLREALGAPPSPPAPRPVIQARPAADPRPGWAHSFGVDLDAISASPASAPVQRRVEGDQRERFSRVYRSVGVHSPDGIFRFEDERNPSARYDESSAIEQASAHRQQVPELRPAHPGQRPNRVQAGLPMDDPRYDDRTRASVNPLDPRDESRVLERDQIAGPNDTLRQVFIQHRENEVARLFGAGTTTADVIAARSLARESEPPVSGAAAAAEEIRIKLFTANQYASVHTLNPRDSVRYQPRGERRTNDRFTACNVYVFDHLRTMGGARGGAPHRSEPGTRRGTR